MSRLQIGSCASIIYTTAIALASFICVAIPVKGQIVKSAADTGRMTWGREDFTRYIGARPCDMAIRNTRFAATREFNPDSTFAIVRRDTQQVRLLPEVVSVANACGSKFSVPTIDPGELWSLFRISLARQDQNQMMEAFNKRLVHSKTIGEQQSVLMQGVYELLAYRPAQIDGVVQLLAKLDAMGEAAIFQRIDVRMMLMNYWYDQYDEDRIRLRASEILQLSKTLSRDQRDLVELREVWRMLFFIAGTTGNLKDQRNVLDSASLQFTSWRGGQGEQWIAGQFHLVNIREEIYLKRASPLPVDAWTNHRGVARPTPGKLSLVLRTSHNCGVPCYGQYGILRQLVAKHGDSIDLTVVVSTDGYTRGTGVLTPAEEVNAIEQYFVKYLNLPVAIGVFNSESDTLPDGRILRYKSRIDDAFSNVDAIITDKNGLIRWFGPLRSRSDQRMIDAVIDKIRAVE